MIQTETGTSFPEQTHTPEAGAAPKRRGRSGRAAARGDLRAAWGMGSGEPWGGSPDIEVENDPRSVAAGHDPQLEKAVEVTLETLEKNPVVIPNHPPYPNYQK